MGRCSWANIWIFLLADFAGAAVAAGASKALNPAEDVPRRKSKDQLEEETAAARSATHKDSYSHN
jgi:hypothetical protein